MKSFGFFALIAVFAFSFFGCKHVIKDSEDGKYEVSGFLIHSSQPSAEVKNFKEVVGKEFEGWILVDRHISPVNQKVENKFGFKNFPEKLNQELSTGCVYEAKMKIRLLSEDAPCVASYYAEVLEVLSIKRINCGHSVDREVSGRISYGKFPMGPAATGVGWLLIDENDTTYALRNLPAEIENASKTCTFIGKMKLRFDNMGFNPNYQKFAEILEVLSLKRTS